MVPAIGNKVRLLQFGGRVCVIGVLAYALED